MLIIACISSHGYGHGARVAALLGALHRQEPDCHFVLSTALAPAFLAQVFQGIPFEQRPCQWDVGVVQADALGSDPEATLLALEKLESELPALLDSETAYLQDFLCRHPGPALVLGDVPPAAVLLAQRLGLPLIWQANFGWDAIYKDMGPAFSPWAQHCAQLYGQGQAVISCPFSLPMPWGIPSWQVGLSCGQPAFSEQQLRQQLRLSHPRERTALLSFGGLGFQLDPALLALWPHWHFLVNDPSLAQAANASLIPKQLRPLDLMPLCSRVLTKPGYSTFCEALSQGLGLLVVERQGFSEAAVLQAGLQQHGWHRLLQRQAFLGGAWQLDQPLEPPLGSPLAKGGEIEGAALLLDQLQSHS